MISISLVSPQLGYSYILYILHISPQLRGRHIPTCGGSTNHGCTVHVFIIFSPLPCARKPLQQPQVIGTKKRNLEMWGKQHLYISVPSWKHFSIFFLGGSIWGDMTNWYSWESIKKHHVVTQQGIKHTHSAVPVICDLIPYIHHGFWGVFNMSGGSAEDGI